MGIQTAKELNILNVGVHLQINQVKSNAKCNVKLGDKLFEGVGKLKDFQLKISMNDSVKPVAQPRRRLLYKMRDLVRKEIDK